MNPHLLTALIPALCTICSPAAFADLPWNSASHYRVLLSVDSPLLNRSHAPASVDIDFPRLLAGLGANSPFNEYTIEVVAYDPSANPKIYDLSRPGPERYLVPHRLDKYYGLSKASLSFVVPDGSCPQFAIYFDTVASGQGKPKRYAGLISDGDFFREGYQKRAIAASKMDDFCDFDGDGDQDLFKVTNEPFIYCYENAGGNLFIDRGKLTSGGEVFVLPHDGNFRSWAVLRFADGDGDGDQDLFAGFTTGDKDHSGRYIAFENTTGAGGPITFRERGPLKTTGGAGFSSSWFGSTAIADWDGDGRKDILASCLSQARQRGLREFHRILFYRNLRTAGDPWDFKLAGGVALKAGEEEILLHSPDVECADIDADGDLDLFAAEQNGKTHLFRNTGTRTAPKLAAGIQVAQTGGHGGVSVADFTGNSLPDMVVGDLWGGGADAQHPGLHARLCKNIGTRSEPKFEDLDAEHGAPHTECFQPIDAGRQNVVRAVDWDNDGKTDLLASSENGSVSVYRNLTDERFPIFTSGRLVLTKLGPAPRTDVCDWNNDGRKDLIVANMEGLLTLFLNEGTDTKPRFGPGRRVEANGKPIDGTHWGNVLVCDWNNDGRKDVVFGMAGEGNKSEHYDWPHLNQNPSQDLGFLFYANVGTDAEPVLGAPKWIRAEGTSFNYLRPNAGSYLDWDDDGKNDLIACEFENVIRFYRNVGSGRPGEEPRLAAGIDIVHPRTVQQVSGAHAVDFNRDGDLDIVTGQGHGGSGLRFFERDYIENRLHNTQPKVTVGKAERKREP